MQSATIRRARETQPVDDRPPDRPRRAVEYVGPTPATDAVIAAETTGPLRYGLRQVAWLVGAVTLVTIVVAVLMVRVGGTGDSRPTLQTVVLLIGAATVVLAAPILLRRWYQSHMASDRLTPQQRRLSRVTGTIRVQERLSPDNAREYWLRAPGSRWMAIDRQTFEQIEPFLVATQRNDLSFQRQTGNDVSRDWAMLDATILFHAHPHAGTVVEIHDADGELVFRHPHYRPEA